MHITTTTVRAALAAALLAGTAVLGNAALAAASEPPSPSGHEARQTAAQPTVDQLWRVRVPGPATTPIP